MSPEDARALLADLREESARLRDPAELQFVGSDPAADGRAAELLELQLAELPGLREQAFELAADAGVPADDVLSVLADHESAARTALSHLRRGVPPVVPRRVQVAPTDTNTATATVPNTTAGAGLGAGPLPEPSWGRGAAVAGAVLAVVVLVALVLLL